MELPTRSLRAIAALFLVSGCASLPPIDERISPRELKPVAEWRNGQYTESSESFLEIARTLHRGDLANDGAAAASHGGMYREAESARLFSRSITANVATRWEILALSRLYLATGEPSTAIREIGTPESGWEHLTKGQALRRIGKNKEAIIEFEQAKITEPGLAIADQERAETYELLGQTDNAIRGYESSLSIDRTQVHLQLRLARLENISGKKKAAFDRLSKYLVMDPSNHEAVSGKANLIKEDAKLLEAEKQQDLGREQTWNIFKAKTASPLPPSPLSPILVGIAPDAASFWIKSSSGFSIECAGKTIGTVGPGEELGGEAEDGRLFLAWSNSTAGARENVRLIPLSPDSCFALFSVHVAPGYFWSEMETRSYRGIMEVRRNGMRLAVINQVPLEEYLLSCVPAEMPASWPFEALKAQAVAARSETLSKKGRHKSEGFDVCSEQHCAVYRGIGNEQRNPTRAVLETRGEILASSGKPVGAVYADNCGGWSSKPQEVWGGIMPGLKSVCDLRDDGCTEWDRISVSPDTRDRFLFSRPESWCRQPDRPSSNYRWTRSYLAHELDAIINRKYKIGRLRRITVLSHTREGRVISIEIAGDAGKQVVKRDSIRSALGGLRSNMFTVEMIPAPNNTENQFIFIGAGWGHGVGLCQTGSRGLALAGKKYRAILAHYYPEASRKKLY